MTRLALLLAALATLTAIPAAAAQEGRPGPLRIEITEGVIEPLPFAIPAFLPASAEAQPYADTIARVVAGDLTSTGLFREIPAEAHLVPVTSFDAPVTYPDWRAINAQALITGAVAVTPEGRLDVRFRLYDVFSGAPLGEGLQLTGSPGDARRIGHKVADAVYSRITGEGGYFDSRVVFVAEDGPKDARLKRLAVMDQDGENLRFLTDASSIVLAPRVSPDGGTVIYTSYAGGFPQVYALDIASATRRPLPMPAEAMTFAPRFAPDNRTVVFSMTEGGNTDLYSLDIQSGQPRRLTSAPSIETAPSFSPDGRQIVFESDRSGTQQLYVMPSQGGEARRISFGPGRYGTPVWSPRGDLIAFTKQNRGRFHIGVMRTDGSDERLLTASFLDEGPSWAPNGRVIAFTRQGAGARAVPALYSVDISGRNLRQMPVGLAGSDPAWSPLLP